MPETSPAAPMEVVRIEVACAGPGPAQIVRAATLPAGATVEDAIRLSGIRDLLPADFAPASVGIFGRIVAADEPLRDGDRVELYRPLRIDPKQARRRRAEKQRR